MNSKIKMSIENYKNRGTKLDAKISKVLLSDIEFKNIQELSDLIGAANSTTLRYTRKLGYKSFKLFYYDYISTGDDDAGGDAVADRRGLSRNVYTYYYEWDDSKILEISKVVKGKIFIITSKRSISTAYFISKRLDIIKQDNKMFTPEDGSLEDFANEISENDTVLLLSVSGFSNIIEKSLYEIAKKTKEKLPTVISISNKRWVKAWEKYDKFYHYQLPSNNETNDWGEYNFISIEILLIIMRILNFSINKK